MTANGNLIVLLYKITNIPEKKKKKNLSEFFSFV